MTVEIIRSNGHITIHCDEGDDFLPAYFQVINETEIVCSNCGSYNIKWEYNPEGNNAKYICNSCGKTWKWIKEEVTQ